MSEGVWLFKTSVTSTATGLRAGRGSAGTTPSSTPRKRGHASSSAGTEPSAKKVRTLPPHLTPLSPPGRIFIVNC